MNEVQAPESRGVIRLTDLFEAPALTDQGTGPSWCVACEPGEPFHATEFEGPSGTEPDTDAIARLVQDGDAAAVVEVGVNDADGDPAVVRLSLEQARELAELLNSLVTDGYLG